MPRMLVGCALVFFLALCVAADGQGVLSSKTQVGPCLDPSSPQCLRSRIDSLSSQLDAADNAMNALRARVTAIQQSLGQHKGSKADGGFDDVWAAIDDINARLKTLKK